jgi:hypothetical protein
MAICRHQALDPAGDSAAGPAALESQLCQAAFGQALEFAHRPAFDRAAARFQPVAADLRLATYLIMSTCLRWEVESPVRDDQPPDQLLQAPDLPEVHSSEVLRAHS